MKTTCISNFNSFPTCTSSGLPWCPVAGEVEPSLSTRLVPHPKYSLGGKKTEHPRISWNFHFHWAPRKEMPQQICETVRYPTGSTCCIGPPVWSFCSWWQVVEVLHLFYLPSASIKTKSDSLVPDNHLINTEKWLQVMWCFAPQMCGKRVRLDAEPAVMCWIECDPFGSTE